MICVVCKRFTLNICLECGEYHCEVHDCSDRPVRRDWTAIIPLVSVTHAESGDGPVTTGPTEEVAIEEVVPENPAEQEQQRSHQREYGTGVMAGLLLGAWIVYATWSDRRKSGLGHQRMEALKAIDEFSKILVPSKPGAVPESISLLPYRRYLFTNGFKFGFIPTPMPFPTVFASLSDMALTVRLGLFTLFAKAEDFARLQHVVDSAAAPRGSMSKRVGKNIVALRNRSALWAGNGYLLGTQTYSALYSFLVSKVRIPTFQGVMTSTILSLQIPWDAAMMFNYFSVEVGKHARALKLMSPAHYARSMSVVNSVLRPMYRTMMGMGLFGTSLAVGVTVPVLMKKYFSDEKPKQ